MPRKPFEVDLGVGGQASTGLSPEAEAVMGFKTERKEEEMPEKKEETTVVTGPVLHTVVVDAPKDLWDVLGHIQMTFSASTYGDVMDIAGQALDMWLQLREDYADLLAEKDLVTAAQVALMERLANEADVDMPDTEGMSKVEASVAIDELKAKAAGNSRRSSGGRSNGNSRSTGRSSGGRSSGGRGGSRNSGGRSNNSRGGGGRGTTSTDPMTDAQYKLIEKLCNQDDEDLPEGIDDYTKADANDFIKGKLDR